MHGHSFQKTAWFSTDGGSLLEGPSTKPHEDSMPPRGAIRHDSIGGSIGTYDVAAGSPFGPMSPRHDRRFRRQASGTDRLRRGVRRNGGNRWSVGGSSIVDRVEEDRVDAVGRCVTLERTRKFRLSGNHRVQVRAAATMRTGFRAASSRVILAMSVAAFDARRECHDVQDSIRWSRCGDQHQHHGQAPQPRPTYPGRAGR